MIPLKRENYVYEVKVKSTSIRKEPVVDKAKIEYFKKLLSKYSTKGDRQMSDNVNHPTHYTSGKFECIDVIEDVTSELKGLQAVCTANVMKYIWRWNKKNGVEDLKKARWYLDKLITSLEADND